MVYTQKITLDISSKAAYRFRRAVSAKQDDNLTRKLNITILVDGSKYNISKSEDVKFRALKPDNKYVITPCSVNEDGTITADLDEQVLAVPGIVIADIVISNKSADRVSTASFAINVEESPVGKAIASSSEFMQLETALKQAQDAADRIVPLADKYDNKLVEIDGKLDKDGHSPSKYLGTDKRGSIVEIDPPSAPTTTPADVVRCVPQDFTPDQKEQISKNIGCATTKDLDTKIGVVRNTLSKQQSEILMSTNNFLDRSRRTANTAINPVNGEEILHTAEESATDYIPVSPSTDYKLGFFFADDTDNSIVANVAWYDAEHRFISGGNGENLRSPAKAAYMRFSCSDIVFTSEYYRPYFGPLSYWKDAKSDDYAPCEVQARYLTPLSVLGQGKVSYEFADADVVYRVTVRETVIGHILMSDGSYVHFDLPNHSTYDIPPTKILVYDCMAHRVRVINQKSLLSWHFVLLQTVDATADYRSHLRGWLTEMQYNPPAVEPYNLNNVSKVYAREVDDKSIEAANISPDGFSFVIHTDMHINTPLPDSTSPTLAVVNRISTQLHPDVILNLGDNVSFGQADHVGQAYYSLMEAVSRIEEKDRAYYVIGNHDYNHDSRISTDRQPRAAIIPYHATYSILGRQHEADVVWGSKDRMYYYKDFPDQKIRLVMLNTSDRPEAWVNIGGTEYDKYTWLKNPVGSAQVDWLIDTALNFSDKPDKKEWSVIFFSHVTPAPNVEYNDAPLYNGDILVKITEAFKTGTSKALSFTDTVFDGYASVNRRCDFASQGAMTVIGWFSGHTHLDTQTVINGITYTTTVCGFADPGVPNSNAMAGMTMAKGEYTEFGIDYCIVDKSARKVTIKRYGINKDRTVRY